MVLLSSLLTGLWSQPSAQPVDLPVQTLERPTYDVFYMIVPPSAGYTVMPIVSPGLDLLPDMIQKAAPTAVAGINAGFFDPANKQTTSYVVTDGKLQLNPVDNRNFVENPDLYPYIAKMLNRSEFRVLDCHGARQYAIAQHRDGVPCRCKLVHSLQAGPSLFHPDAITDEAFVATKNGQRVRDPLGVDRKNARSAIGIDDKGRVILAMAAMKATTETPSGVSLAEMSDLMRELGAHEALSLDGGSSSTLWAGGQTYYGKLDKAFHPVKRPIKSALVVIRED